MKVRTAVRLVKESGGVKINGQDECVVGIYSSREGARLVYETDRMLDKLQKDRGHSPEEAQSFFNKYFLERHQENVLFIQITEDVVQVKDVDKEEIVVEAQSKMQGDILHLFESPSELVVAFGKWVEGCNLKGLEGLSIRKLTELFSKHAKESKD